MLLTVCCYTVIAFYSFEKYKLIKYSIPFDYYSEIIFQRNCLGIFLAFYCSKQKAYFLMVDI